MTGARLDDERHTTVRTTVNNTMTDVEAALNE